MTRRPPVPYATATPLLLALAAALVLVPATGALGPGPAASPTDADAPGMTEAPWGAWLATTLDDRSVSGDTTIAFTSDDQPYVQYKLRTGDGAYIRVIHRTAFGEWTGHTFDVRGYNADLTLDGEDDPHVAWERGFGTGTELFYAHRQPDGSWTKTVLATAEKGIGETRVEVNGTDHPRVSFYMDGRLRYTWKTDVGWQSEFVMEHPDSGFILDHAMDLAPDGTPHIAYRDGLDVYHAVKQDGSWKTELAQHSCIFDVSIAVDHEGTPHMACRIDDKGMAHVWKTSDGWKTTIVDDGSAAVFDRDPDTVVEPSIKVDDEGDPRIGYRYIPNFASPRLAPGQPHYAERVDGEWHVEIVDRDGQHSGLGLGLALDSEDRPFLSYIRDERFEGGGGFPGSGQFQSLLDLRLARPGQAEAASQVGQ